MVEISKIDNVTEEWPIRRFFAAKSGEAFCEIAVTTGLLKTLKTQDELAFLLGHELTHLIEHHSQQPANGLSESSNAALEASFRRWWSRQAFEAVADLGGLEKMLGHYELEAALSAIIRLYSSSSNRALETRNLTAEEIAQEIVATATARHHHEGLRISTLQAKIESLRHSDLLATKRSQKVIFQNWIEVKSLFLQDDMASLVLAEIVNNIQNSNLSDQEKIDLFLRAYLVIFNNKPSFTFAPFNFHLRIN